MDWLTDPEEDVLIHSAATFATGMAPAVSGQRWFRDTGRNDMQGELVSAGWPPGPDNTPRTAGNKASRRVGGALASALALVTSLVLNENNVGSGDDKPEDPENEVDDFPVMWAAPGTLARTLPWQLDPARRPKSYITDLVITNHRLLFVGSELGLLEHADVLCELPLDALAEARHMQFSKLEADVRLTFADRSWVRLFTGARNSAERLEQMHSGTVRMLSANALTEGQQREAARFCTGKPKTSYPPTYAMLPSGTVLMEVRSPSKFTAGCFDVAVNLMDETGGRTGPQPGDPSVP
ncbi:hypothetical protein [Streptomyces sp. Je 1-369]|uniref:hypothetical protein n=1 Tax=Streptomyces sp. Je 1-369 TaxID=2966192 RepID=UPI0022859F90|nr:hypothetical protein [Streptomyces sp. Je 1-369]WAL95943.1 hypothetical protein NOO62_16465 [Streptomyces sp. Je 1-369]